MKRVGYDRSKYSRCSRYARAEASSGLDAELDDLLVAVVRAALGVPPAEQTGHLRRQLHIAHVAESARARSYFFSEEVQETP